MNVIQEITSQTSAGTNATAKSIGNLAEMANQPETQWPASNFRKRRPRIQYGLIDGLIVIARRFWWVIPPKCAVKSDVRQTGFNTDGLLVPAETAGIEDSLFIKWQELLEDRIGLSLPVHRKVFLQTNLSVRMREIGCVSYEEYFDKVKSGTAGVIEWLILVDRLTVQETWFYRDPDALDLVRNYVLTRPRNLLEKHPLAVWSVGCSSGEEPYSLAMLLNECFSVLMSGIISVLPERISVSRYWKKRRREFIPAQAGDIE